MIDLRKSLYVLKARIVESDSNKERQAAQPRAVGDQESSTRTKRQAEQVVEKTTSHIEPRPQLTSKLPTMDEVLAQREKEQEKKITSPTPVCLFNYMQWYNLVFV